MSLNTTPKTWTAALVTVADLNTEIRDAITGIQAAWTSYTPTLTNITLGNGVLSFAYSRTGKTVVGIRGSFQAGTTTTYAAGTLGFSLPFAAASIYGSASITTGFGVGAALIQPTVATRTAGTVYIDKTNQVFNFIAGSGANLIVTNTVPGTFGAASSSTITFTATYEAA